MENIKTGGVVNNKMIPWNKGKKNVYSKETLLKMSNARIGKSPGNKGIPCSDEQKEKQRIKMKGRTVSLETRIKMSETSKRLDRKPPSALGRKMSNEAKIKISIANTGRKSSKKGIKISEETKKKISESRIGNKHWNWQGGLSFEEYPVNWQNILKEDVRKRDNYCCKICGQKQNELKSIFKKLAVHHIDYNKQNCDINNLITLCQSCHSKTNFNREYWIDYFGVKYKKYVINNI